MRIHTDLSQVAISVAPSPATSGTTLGVTDANAAYLPDVYPYWATLVPTGLAPTRANSEIVKVTAGSSSAGTTTLTIVRAQGIPVTTAQTVTTSFDIYDANSADVSLVEDGWTSARGAWTYASADAPTFVITVPSGAASIYGVGDRIKLTQTTVKYFIVTAVTDTTLTVYGGTDYTLANAAISLNYYSHQKAPLGFPISPAKWQQTLSSTTSRSTSTPTQNTWYNAESLVIPIGVWKVNYYVMFECYDTTATDIDAQSTLSTTNNGETDTDFRASFYMTLPSGNPDIFIPASKDKFLVLAAKTTYYLNYRTTLAGIAAVAIRGDRMTTVINAVCAYL